MARHKRDGQGSIPEHGYGTNPETRHRTDHSETRFIFEPSTQKKELISTGFSAFRQQPSENFLQLKPFSRPTFCYAERPIAYGQTTTKKKNTTERA